MLAENKLSEKFFFFTVSAVFVGGVCLGVNLRGVAAAAALLTLVVLAALATPQQTPITPLQQPQQPQTKQIQTIYVTSDLTLTQRPKRHAARSPSGQHSNRRKRTLPIRPRKQYKLCGSGCQWKGKRDYKEPYSHRLENRHQHY